LAFKGKMKQEPVVYQSIAPLHTEITLGKGSRGQSPPKSAALSFLMFTPEGNGRDMALMGRGYGVYLLNGRMGLFRHHRTEGHKSGGARGKLIVPEIVAATNADVNRKDGLDELLFATPDGKVYEADNVGFDVGLNPHWSNGPHAGDYGYKWVNETP